MTSGDDSPRRPGVWCSGCRYDLSAGSGTACPECGTAFDRNDPSTFLRSPVAVSRRAIARFLGVAAWAWAVLAVAAFTQSLFAWHGPMIPVNLWLAIALWLTASVGAGFLSFGLVAGLGGGASRIAAAGGLLAALLVLLMILMVVLAWNGVLEDLGFVGGLFGLSVTVAFLALPGIGLLQLIAASLMSSVPASRRTWITVLASLVIVASIVTLNWPFRASFHLHRPAFDAAVEQLADMPLRPPADGREIVLSGGRSIGLYRFDRVIQRPDGVVVFGFGKVDGLQILRSVDGTAVHAWGRNWTRSLGGGWSLSEAD